MKKIFQKIHCDPNINLPGSRFVTHTIVGFFFLLQPLYEKALYLHFFCFLFWRTLQTLRTLMTNLNCEQSHLSVLRKRPWQCFCLPDVVVVVVAGFLPNNCRTEVRSGCRLFGTVVHKWWFQVNVLDELICCPSSDFFEQMNRFHLSLSNKKKSPASEPI